MAKIVPVCSEMSLNVAWKGVIHIPWLGKARLSIASQLSGTQTVTRIEVPGAAPEARPPTIGCCRLCGLS